MSATKTDCQEPEAWVGCLACYNAGRLVGTWVEGIEAGEITSAQIHETESGRFDLSSHEELWVFDFQGYWGALTSECSPAEAQRVAEAFNGLESYEDPRAYGAWIAECGGSVDESLDNFRAQFLGEWDSEEDYAQSFAEDIGAIDDDARWPAYCIDWKRAARDLFMDLTSVNVPGGGIFVFDQNR